MVGPNSSLIGGIIAALTLFLLTSILETFLYKSKKFSSFLQGEPLMLIYNGKPIHKHLEKAKISDDELEAAIREHGVAKVSEVNLAVLERDGNISVLSNNYKNRTVRKRKAHEIFSREVA